MLRMHQRTPGDSGQFESGCSAAAAEDATAELHSREMSIFTPSHIHTRACISISLTPGTNLHTVPLK